MKIARIEVYQKDLPYSGCVYRLSGGRTFEVFDATYVRLVAEDGTDGWGESTPFGATYIAAHARGVRAGLREVAPAVLGLDPRHTDRINDAMDAALVGHAHAKTPIDVACWDLFGKAVGMPVCDLLGGGFNRALPLISSIHAGEPDDMRARVADHRERGDLGHSVKVGALDGEGGPALDAERIVASLADRQRGEYFLVDANGGLSVENGRRLLALLPDSLDFVFEAPCATWAETVAFRRFCPYPIVLDELADSDASVAQILSDGIADGVGLKISKAGGLTHGRRQRDICIAGGLTFSVQDTVGSSVSFAAILHLGQTVPEATLRCVGNPRDMITGDPAICDVISVAGGVQASKTPGLGITMNVDQLGEPVDVWTL